MSCVLTLAIEVLDASCTRPANSFKFCKRLDLISTEDLEKINTMNNIEHLNCSVIFNDQESNRKLSLYLCKD